MIGFEQQFLDAIAKEPHIDEPKLIFADWLEEQGDPRAEAWRWIVAKRKRPLHDYSETFYWYTQHPKPMYADYLSEIDAYTDLVRVFVAARENGWAP